MILLFVVCGAAARGLRHPATARVFATLLWPARRFLALYSVHVREYVGFTLPTIRRHANSKALPKCRTCPSTVSRLPRYLAICAGCV